MGAMDGTTLSQTDLCNSEKFDRRHGWCNTQLDRSLKFREVRPAPSIEQHLDRSLKFREVRWVPWTVTHVVCQSSEIPRSEQFPRSRAARLLEISMARLLEFSAIGAPRFHRGNFGVTPHLLLYAVCDVSNSAFDSSTSSSKSQGHRLKFTVM